MMGHNPMKPSKQIRMNRRSALRGIVTVSGVAVSLPLMGSLAGCSSGPNASLSGRMELIDMVSNLIIPQTDTPGARASGVPAYIEAVFTDHFTDEQQRDFVTGLDVFDELASASGAENFVNAAEDIQKAVLTGLDEGPDDQSGHAIWRQLRDITIFGFYTSEQATQELSFEETPGRYEACLPLEEVGRAWLDRGV